MNLNTTAISALGIDMPEDAQEQSNLPVPDPIHPSELVIVDNPNLPEMEDIETSLIEGERQLETLIQNGFDMFKALSEERSTIQPNYRNSHLERLIMIFQSTADVVKYKTELQLKKKKARLDDAKFPGRPGSKQESEDGTPAPVTNIFIQKDIVKMIAEAKLSDIDKAETTSEGLENFSDAPGPK